MKCYISFISSYFSKKDVDNGVPFFFEYKNKFAPIPSLKYPFKCDGGYAIKDCAKGINTAHSPIVFSSTLSGVERRPPKWTKENDCECNDEGLSLYCSIIYYSE